MAQVAVSAVPLPHPHKCAPPSRARQNSFQSSGRGGSGNIRRLQVPTDDERSDNAPVVSPRGRAAEKRPERVEPQTGRRGTEKLLSSGRGGSGNIQASTSKNLEAYPLTAAIVHQYSIMETQREERVRKTHAESKVVRSSGRGGSGNISDPRRRSCSQGHSGTATPKNRLFTRKGREKGPKSLDGVAQAHDTEDSMDRRTSYATCSSGSGGSSALAARYGQESCASSVLTSRDSMISDALSCEDARTRRFGKRESFLACWGRPPLSIGAVTLTLPGSPSPRSPSTTSTYPPSFHASSPGSSPRVYSPTSVISEDREYVSFLEL